jgi:1-acyl-sn-glycerol-3-phosphate acyltransferase
MEPVYAPVIALARVLFSVQGLRFRLVGEQHVPRTGGAVMMVNHTGYFDFTYAGLTVLKAKRLVRFMAKQSIWKNPVAGPLMSGMKHIPVDREAGAESYAAALAALRRGEIVGVFPEATISRSFELKEFKSGGVRLAQQAQVPVLPTTIWGSQRVWTKGHPRRLGRHNFPIYITVGAPMEIGAHEDLEAAAVRIKEVMQAQLLVDQAEYPPMPADEHHLLPLRLGGTAPSLEEANVMDAEEQRLRREQRSRGTVAES